MLDHIKSEEKRARLTKEWDDLNVILDDKFKEVKTEQFPDLTDNDLKSSANIESAMGKMRLNYLL